MAAHLARCPACRSFADDLEGVTETLRAAPLAEPPSTSSSRAGPHASGWLRRAQPPRRRSVAVALCRRNPRPQPCNRIPAADIQLAHRAFGRSRSGFDANRWRESPLPSLRGQVRHGCKGCGATRSMGSGAQADDGGARYVTKPVGMCEMPHDETRRPVRMPLASAPPSGAGREEGRSNLEEEKECERRTRWAVDVAAAPSPSPSRAPRSGPAVADQKAQDLRVVDRRESRRRSTRVSRPTRRRRTSCSTSWIRSSSSARAPS